MKTKKEKLRFQRECAKLLLRLGAEDREEYAGSRRFVLQTTLGELHLFPFDGWLATRFEDVPRATATLNPQRDWAGQLNTYSGKWNFHFQDGVTVEAALLHIGAELEALLPTDTHEAASASLVARLKAMGYTEDDLERSNPHNAWMQEH